MRAFVAIELESELRRALAAVRGRELLAGRGVRWVAEDRIHLTVRFLGEIPESRVPVVTTALEEASLGVAPFELRLRGLGCFPNSRAPRVLWAGVETSAHLQRLAERVEEELQRCSFPPEERPFRAHITVARIKARGVRLREELELERPAFGAQKVEKLLLMESQLAPSGPSYRTVAEMGLTGSEKREG